MLLSQKKYLKFLFLKIYEKGFHPSTFRLVPCWSMRAALHGLSSPAQKDSSPPEIQVVFRRASYVDIAVILREREKQRERQRQREKQSVKQIDRE